MAGNHKSPGWCRVTLGNKTAFTIIEMLIVVVIIGVLAGALIPRLIDTQSRARDSARKVKIGQASTAIGLYKEDSGAYPIAPFYKDPGAQSTIATLSGVAPFISAMPTDPGKGTAAVISADSSCVLVGDSFAYTSDAVGKMFAVTALSESKKGNTTNCLGVIDAPKNASFDVVGVGLKTNTIAAGAAYNQGQDGDPVAWCIAHLTQEEVDELNTVGPEGTPTNYTIEERCNVNRIGWSNTPIVPNGYQKLVNLTSFGIENKNLSSLNLSNNTNLTELYVGETNISSLNLSNNTSLEHVYLYNNKLTSIDFPQNPRLDSLYIGHNQLSSLSPEICDYIYSKGWTIPSIPYYDHGDYYGDYYDYGNLETDLCRDYTPPTPRPFYCGSSAIGPVDISSRNCEQELTDDDLNQLNALGRNVLKDGSDYTYITTYTGTKENWCNDSFRINWSNKGLSSLPNAISKLDNPNIFAINLTYNNITSLPDLSRLIGVTGIGLEYNPFYTPPDPTYLPPSLTLLDSSIHPTPSNYCNRNGENIETRQAK